MANQKEIALIVGVGKGLSASLARLFAREGMTVALAARNADKIAPLAQEIGALTVGCDASDPGEVGRLFDTLKAKVGDPTLVVFNAGMRGRGPIADLDPESVHSGWLNGCFGGFLVAQQAAKRMLPKAAGTILITGATASVKGFAESAPFAMTKFGLRGLAQCMARELAPKGIHVAHVVIDGGIASSVAKEDGEPTDRWLNPDAIAETYLQLHRQHRSAWTWEIEVRPWVEKF
jgi:NAD(P)-dependent dehydrogenase (short-subunit alcohol dehydrogenase family)